MGSGGGAPHLGFPYRRYKSLPRRCFDVSLLNALQCPHGMIRGSRLRVLQNGQTAPYVHDRWLLASPDIDRSWQAATPSNSLDEHQAKPSPSHWGCANKDYCFFPPEMGARADGMCTARRFTPFCRTGNGMPPWITGVIARAKNSDTLSLLFLVIINKKHGRRPPISMMHTTLQE